MINADPEAWYQASAQHMARWLTLTICGRSDCPVLFVWATGDDLADLYGDPAAIWST